MRCKPVMIIFLLASTLSYASIDDLDTYRAKTKKFCKVITQNLRVCDSALIRGDLIVDGNIISSSIPAPVVLPLVAYGYASRTTDVLVLDGDDVPFTSFTPSLNVSYTASSSVPSGTAAVLPAGTYQFMFSATGRANGIIDPLSFGLVINGSPDVVVPNSQYISEEEVNILFADVDRVRIVKGYGIFTIAAQASISLRNFTSENVLLTDPGLTTNSANDVRASMTFIRIGD